MARANDDNTAAGRYKDSDRCITDTDETYAAVSYTHLDVYKRQVPHGSVLRGCRGGSAFGQLLPEFFASCEVISSAAVPRTPHSHIELGHILLTGTTPALGGVGAVITEVEAS